MVHSDGKNETPWQSHDLTREPDKHKKNMAAS